MSSVHETEQLVFTVLLQLIVMIAAARAMHLLFRRLGQPGVIGEILAGLLLGPSLLGWIAPGLSQALFGDSFSPAITIISQVGLCLLMFQIGSEFEFAHLKEGRARNATGLIALASLAAPFGLGILLGWWSHGDLAPRIDRTLYSLFIGVGLAITALPILGRILVQFDLNRHPLGVIAISAAAVNDVVGWLMLAALSALAAAQLSASAALVQVGGLVALVLAARFLLAPLSGWLVRRYPVQEGVLSPTLMAIALCLIFTLAIATFALGIFAIFGGFLAGLLFHRHVEFVAAWRRQVGMFVLVFFLPVFFTFTGLRTDVTQFGGDLHWLALVLAFAILGKIVPVYLAARVAGMSSLESWTLGSLMNTRALMELIVLNIGFDMGFLPRSMFSMLVVMAVVTTLMTGPLLQLLLPRIGHRVTRVIEA